MADIFISYKREDQEEHGRVAPIAEALRAEGYDVFYDVQVPPGSSWERVLQDKMNQARCVLVLWSEASVRSDWVKEEAEMAKHDGKLIPVFLDPVSPPFGFARIEGADLSNWNGDLSHVEWENLVAAVRARIGTGEGDTAPGVSRVAYSPSKTVRVEKRASGKGSGGGAGKWLGGIAAVLALAVVGFFGWQMYENNQRLADRAEDEATAQAMTRGIDERTWREATDANTIAAYRRYLDARPTGAYRRDALARIEALEKAAEADAARDRQPTPPPQPAGKADLAIAGLELGTRDLSPGDKVRARVQVRNMGEAPAPGSGDNGYMVDFVLGRDNTAPVRWASFQENWSEDAMLRGGRASNTETIAPDTSRDIITALEIPEAWPAGRFNLCAVVDPGGRVDESDTGNNVLCAAVNIQSSTPARAELRAVGETAAAEAPGAQDLSGRSFSINGMTVSNISLSPAQGSVVTPRERVVVRYAFSGVGSGTYRVWFIPEVRGSGCRAANSGSQPHQGRGRRESYFLSTGDGCRTGEITAIHITVKNEATGNEDRQRVPVSYKIDS